VKTLYLRIYATVLAVLVAFALGSAWLFHRQVEQERERFEHATRDRLAAWAELIQTNLPPPAAPADEQLAAVRDWAQKLRVPLALEAADGTLLGGSDAWQRRHAETGQRGLALRLDDGRTLYVARPGRLGLRRDGTPAGMGGPGGFGAMQGPGGPDGGPPGGLRAPPDRMLGSASDRLIVPPFGPLPGGIGLVVLLVVLFIAVAAGAFPVVRALTRRLEALKRGVERFGAGALDHRVAIDGRDEVAAVARSFNDAAGRIEALVRSHQSLLANASHELRSPLARLKMALGMLDDAPPAQRAALQREVATNIAELDALVDEVLLASRLDAGAGAAGDKREPVDLLALAAEEGARTGAAVDGRPATVQADERLLRRALRNLLENARRYGGGAVELEVLPRGGEVDVAVRDRGPGVPAESRERIFEPFYRLPGHAEQAGGVGLGLSLVRQIAQRHGGRVRCDAREGGGSVFTLTLPV
jgi:signal transduction histidine kinase